MAEPSPRRGSGAADTTATADQRDLSMAASGLVITQIRDVTVANFRDSSILDSVAVDAIARELYPLVDEKAVRKLVLDFSSVRFLSSQMLGVLLSLQKKIASIKGRMVICGLRAELFKVFKIMKLEKILTFAENEEKALNSFSQFADG